MNMVLTIKCDKMKEENYIEYNDISLTDKQIDEMDNQIRDTYPDDDYFEMNEPGYYLDTMTKRIVYED